MKEPKRYYSLVENTENDVADLYIFGDISSWGQWHEDDPDRSAYNIVKELQGIMVGNINVHINSYGGEVAEGLAIYNTLRTSGRNVTTICDGFACSAASVVFMGGSKRVMSPASLLMIHNAWTFAMGNSEELRKQADDLETITQASVEAYKLGASISEEEIRELMANETWILPEQAVEWGFATDIDDEDDDDREPKQSAFRMIMEKLTTPNVRIGFVEDTQRIDPDDLADRILEKLLLGIQAEADQESEDIETPADTYGWHKFFTEG